MKAADDLFIDSEYSSLISETQKSDRKKAIENVPMPNFYVTKNEPKAQPGKNMGLEVIIDAHSDTVESISVNSNYEGFTVLVTDPSNFLLTNLRGFEVRPGLNFNATI